MVVNYIQETSQIYCVTHITPNLKLDYRQFKTFEREKRCKGNGQGNIKSRAVFIT